MTSWIKPKHSWSFFKKRCLCCNKKTTERVIHYFHIVKKSGRVKRLAARNAEHYLCHQQTCIDWRCIKLCEDICKTAEEAAKEIAKAKLEQSAKVAGP